MRYTAHGKQVMRDRQHFADAATEQVAQIIVTALNAMRGDVETLELPALLDPFPKPGEIITFEDGVEPMRVRGEPVEWPVDWTPLHLPRSLDISITHRHDISQQSDEYACSCGKRWDVRDGEEHP